MNLATLATLALASTSTFASAIPDSCISYTDYSSAPHGNGAIPSMRPPPECRTFNSTVIENVISDTVELIRDPSWKQLFTNVFPNTLDTTVAWQSTSGTAYSFLITGDITAQWLRDSANQVLPYLPYANQDTQIAQLILGLINLQAEELVEDVFGNAFQPPKFSTLKPTPNGIAIDLQVVPGFNNETVFEAKFEIDSWASFLQISTQYWRTTRDSSFIRHAPWVAAVQKILDAAKLLQVPTVLNGRKLSPLTVGYSRNTDTATETQFGGGRGNPVKYTGMVKTLFRPSDDATIFPFLVPANAFLSVELANLAEMLATLGAHFDLAKSAQQLADEIREGVFEYGTTVHPKYGKVFAYETDGYGSVLIMDDANGPSLLSLPYLGFVDANDPVYVNTRRLILSTDNPWYFTGSYIRGIGSPHTGFLRVWPMAVAMQAMTSDDVTEVKECLETLKSSTSGLGLMHESVNVDYKRDYTRSWFAWCNSLVGQLVVDVLRRFPGII